MALVALNNNSAIKHKDVSLNVTFMKNFMWVQGPNFPKYECFDKNFNHLA